jgi:hypothetical protein
MRVFVNKFVHQIYIFKQAPANLELFLHRNFTVFFESFNARQNAEFFIDEKLQRQHQLKK